MSGAMTNAFNSFVLNGMGGPRFASVLASLEGSTAVMLIEVCHMLGVRENSTYGAAFNHCNTRMAHGMSPLA